MAKQHIPTLTSKGLYRVGVGYRLSNGIRQGANHWLGKDKFTAELITKALENAWESERTIDPQGNKIWSQTSIDNAYRRVGANPPGVGPRIAPINSPAPVESPAPQKTQTVAPRTYNHVVTTQQGITLYQALDRFVVYQGERCQRNDVSARHKDDIENRIKSIKRHLNDIPLADVDAQHLEKMRGTITARPASLIGDGDPISPATLQGWLMLLGMAFDYFAHPKSRINWTPPYPQWREVFNLDMRQKTALMTNEEIDQIDQPKPTFTLPQLAGVYANARPKEKMYILMGICLGWTQQEISTFRRSEIYETPEGEMFIKKARSKTSVKTEWWIAPELAVLIRDFTSKAIDPASPDYAELAILSDEGNPIIHGGTDNVALAWNRLKVRMQKAQDKRDNKAGLKTRTPVTWFGFSTLRKLAGQLAENLSGDLSLAKLLLAHKGGSVARKHYVGLGVNIGVGRNQFQRLHDLQREIHKALQLHVINPPKTEVKQSNKAA